MYEQFYHLQRRPFPATPDLNCFFDCETVSGPLGQLRVCMEHGQGIGILTAPAGAGKTLLCQHVLAELESRFVTVFLGNSNFPTPRSLLQAILFELNVDYSNDEDQELRHQLRSTLQSLRPEHEALVLAIDEAHEFAVELLEEIRLLADIAVDGQSLVRVILSGQLELEERMTDRAFNAINQRIGTHAFLEPLSIQESIDYLNFRLESAGGKPGGILTEDSASLIARASGGVPRCLNQLADHSLLLSFASDHSPVQIETVREALDDLKQLPLHWNDVSDGISVTGYQGDENEVETSGENLSESVAENNSEFHEASTSEDSVFEFGADSDEPAASADTVEVSAHIEHSDGSSNDADERGSNLASESGTQEPEAGDAAPGETVSGFVYDITADAGGVGEVRNGVVDLGEQSEADNIVISEESASSSFEVPMPQDTDESARATHDEDQLFEAAAQQEGSDFVETPTTSSRDSDSPSSTGLDAFVEDSLNEIEACPAEECASNPVAPESIDDSAPRSETTDECTRKEPASSTSSAFVDEQFPDDDSSQGSGDSGIVWNLGLAGAHASKDTACDASGTVEEPEAGPSAADSEPSSADFASENTTETHGSFHPEEVAVDEAGQQSDSTIVEQSPSSADESPSQTVPSEIQDHEPVFAIEFVQATDDETSEIPIESGQESAPGPEINDTILANSSSESDSSNEPAVNALPIADDPSSGTDTPEPAVRESRPDCYIDAIVPMLGEIDESAASSADQLPDRSSFAIEADLVENVSHADPEIEDEIGAAMLDLCLDTQWSIQESEQRRLDHEEEIADDAEFLNDADSEGSFPAYDVVQPEEESFSIDPDSIASEPESLFHPPAPPSPVAPQPAAEDTRPYGRLFSDLRRRQQAGE